MRGFVAVLVTALALAGPAGASQRFADLDVRSPTLRVGSNGIAVVSYTTTRNVRRHVLVWGAIDARVPAADVPQVRFRLDYAGGYRAFRNAGYWRGVGDTCKAYDGPPLADLVAACTASDGSYWALQAWQRSLPLLGFDPWLPSQTAVELHVSHWSGPLVELDVWVHRSYGGRFIGLFGRAKYDGLPVHGFGSTATGAPRDGFGRNVYIDTLDSAYGPGWRRETGILLHTPTGTFCHSFVAQRPPAGYPSQDLRPAAPGSRYRVTMIGPGVTPDVVWEGPGLTDGDPGASPSLFDSVMAGDNRCAPER
jgi:hypothetical protein